MRENKGTGANRGKRRGGENATSLFTSVISVSSVSSCKNLPAYWSLGHRRSGSARTVEITSRFRVPLALPVFVTRSGHSDSALAEPVAHGSEKRLSHRPAHPCSSNAENTRLPFGLSHALGTKRQLISSLKVLEDSDRRQVGMREFRPMNRCGL